jgi:hypothetical protein
MSVFLHHFMIGAAGAAAFEALKLWELQGKLTEAKFRKLLHSASMWIPLSLMLAASGFFAWAYYEGDAKATTWNFVLAGIAARTLVREVASASFAHSKIKLGSVAGRQDPDTPHVRDFFE